MGEIVAKREVSREQVMELEAVMKKLPQIDLTENVKHHFADGVYVRELFIPEGTLATGKIHRHQVMNILVYGVVQITTDDGMQTIVGPAIFNSKPGTKKAAFALTDILLLNVHPTKLTDLDEIEKEFIAPSVDALECDHKEYLS